MHGVVDFPAGPGPFPTLVLAPGQRYPLERPALAETARQLVAAGVAVYRFDWAYLRSEPPGEPSAGLSAETRELAAMLGLARAEPRVAQQSLWVGGKSMGSVVAWRLLQADTSLRGGVMLTPLCTRPVPGEATAADVAELNYPGFASERRPSLWIAGDADPQCDGAALQRHAARAPVDARVRTARVAGNHSFEDRSLAGPSAAAFRERQVHAVARQVVGFITGA